MDKDLEPLLWFAQMADEFGSLDQLTTAVALASRVLGVTSVSANRILAPRREVRPGMLFGMHWAEWSALYVKSRYHMSDPAYRMLREQNRCFLWTEARARFSSPAGRRVMDACREITGCAEGFVVPVRDSDSALFSAAFCGPQLELSPMARVALHLAGVSYVTRGRELLEGVALDPICPLTPQQLHCLTGVLIGETDIQIGRRLGLSRYTVHNHIEAAKRRLNTTKRAVAAQEAWRRGWLD